jgi:hypothetical protein
MVPADTFPAEWANYLFHGATAGITRLNQDTGSIKREINSVLSNFNITPDATLNNQLLAALNKLKAEAALAAHPVGSLYWTSVNENPATTFGGGTWVQIKDKFILAAGDTYANGATGGSATITLTVEQLPSHNHSMSHTHSVTTIAQTCTGGSATVPRTECDFTQPKKPYQQQWSGVMNGNAVHSHEVYRYSQSAGNTSSYLSGGDVADCNGTASFIAPGGTTNNVNLDHSHLVEIPEITCTGGSATVPRTACEFTQPTAPGQTVTSSDSSSGYTSLTGERMPVNIMPPYIVKYCWERTA